MKVGSIIYDDHGNQYVIRTLLGRGLSCKTFVVGFQRPDQIDKDPSKRHLRGLAETGDLKHLWHQVTLVMEMNIYLKFAERLF